MSLQNREDKTFIRSGASKPTPMIDLATSAVRSGKWSREEEEFAEVLMREFRLGTLPGVEEGVSLRRHLSHELGCSPKRISKKFEGTNYNGKQVFVKSHSLSKAELEDKIEYVKMFKDRFVESVVVMERAEAAKSRTQKNPPKSSWSNLHSAADCAAARKATATKQAPLVLGNDLTAPPQTAQTATFPVLPVFSQPRLLPSASSIPTTAAGAASLPRAGAGTLLGANIDRYPVASLLSPRMEQELLAQVLSPARSLRSYHRSQQLQQQHQQLLQQQAKRNVAALFENSFGSFPSNGDGAAKRPRKNFYMN